MTQSVGHPIDSSALTPSLATALYQAAQTTAGIRYITYSNQEQTVTYRHLWQQASQIATALENYQKNNQQIQQTSKHHHNSPSNIVILQCSTSHHLLTALWACILNNDIPVPVPVQATSESSTPLIKAIELLDSPIVLTDQATEKAIAPQLAALKTSTPPSLTLESLQSAIQLATPHPPSLIPNPNNIALILLTSGSTGNPKGVQLTHHNLITSIYGMATANRLTASDITLNWMPLEHVASLVMFHLTEVYLGCEQIHVSQNRILKDPLSWLDLLEQHKATVTWAPNFAYGLINDQADEITRRAKSRPWNLSHIRWMGNGAEAVVGKTARQFLKLLAPHNLSSTAISPGYGMSETSSGIVHSQNFSLETTKDTDTFVNVGHPIPGTTLRIVDEQNNPLPQNTIGQLQVKGPTIMAGYYPRNTETERSRSSDDWFNTEDLGFLSKDGTLTITGRQKDIIIIGGTNYYSHDLESVVEQLDSIETSFTAACGVRSAQDATEQLAIFFVPSTTASIIDLVSQIRTQLVTQVGISPTYVIPVEKADIPKTAIGKIQRSQLVKQFENQQFNAQLESILSAFKLKVKQYSKLETESIVTEIWKSALKAENLTPHDNFFDLGGTSLKLMQVLSQLQNELDPTLNALTLFQNPTIATLSTYLHKAEKNNTPITIRERSTSTATSPIAIIGMAGRFPGANNLEQFWQNLKDGKESITFFTDEELLESGVDPKLLQNPNYVKASPILEDVDHFDADFFGYSPKEAKLMDPQQRLLLECAWESLENAGYDPFTYPGSIGLYAGATLNTYLLNHVYPNRHKLDPNESLNTFNLSSFGGFQTAIANDKDYLTTRISYKLNLRGPSINVQTACSTSLTAIHLAVQSLLQGECDMAIAGGVSVETPQKNGYLYQEGMILSADGHCRAFDNSSRGTLFGSGVGLVVLKRLNQAIADKDFIYATIKGSAIGNDGGQKVGYLAPLSEGQARVAAEALTLANTPADTIGYVEAHGTGTQLGDPIELTALTQAFRLSPKHIRTDINQFCPIGSVKTNVGHLNIASGIVGFIKATLAIHHAQIPASLHFEQPNTQIDFASSPFYVNTELTNWPQKETPRRASVNSLGIGGTNVHIVLEEKKQEKNQEESNPERNFQLLCLSSKSEKGLLELSNKYLQIKTVQSSFDDLCFTASVGRSHFNYRLAIVATSAKDLKKQLKARLAKPIKQHRQNGTIALLFTGQGAQFFGMGAELYQTHPIFKSAIDRCADYLKTANIDLLHILFNSSEDNNQTIHQTKYTQPVLFSFEYALAQLWLVWGVQPSALLGHSLGEYVAACIAGVFSLEEALKLVVARGQLMQSLRSTGKMLAVMADLETVKLLVEEVQDIAIAAINTPQKIVLSGSKQTIHQITQKLEAKDIRYKALKVSHAFHSPLMAPMLSDFRQVAESITYHPAKIEIISNLTGKVTDVATPNYWVEHISNPVLFASSIKTLRDKKITTFIECGPRPILITLAKEILEANTYTWLPSLHPNYSDNKQILSSLATLYQQGQTVNWQAFYKGRECHRIPLPTYAFQRKRYWLETPKIAANYSGDNNLDKQNDYPMGDRAAHPLLGRRISTPLQQIIFQQTISANQPDFLQGHRVQDNILLPGAAYLELAIAAATQVLHTTSIQLTNVSITKAIALRPDPITLQTLLTPTEPNHYKFEIYTHSDNHSNNHLEWTLHAEGTFSKHERLISKVNLTPPATPPLPASSHYASCKQRGLDYTHAFQSVEKIWPAEKPNTATLGQINLSSISSLSNYQLHPAALDSCFQCILTALPTDSSTDTYIPIGLDSLTVYQPFKQEDSTVFSKIHLSSTDTKSEIVSADIEIASATGEVIAQITGLSAKRISSPASSQSTWKNWLYQIEWQPLPLQHTHQAPPKTHKWLIISDSQKQLNTLSAQLATQPQSCQTIQLSDTQSLKSQLSTLLSTLNLQNYQGVIYTSRRNTSQSYQDVLELTQSLIQANASSKLWLITHNTQSITTHEPLDTTQSPLWGMAKTIAIEHPEFDCTCVDLDRNDSQPLITLTNELQSDRENNRKEHQIAYRNNTRYVARLTLAARQDAASHTQSHKLKNHQLKILKRGTLEQLQWQEIPRQSPKANEVEICVQASGLNFRDVLNALDLYPEETPEETPEEAGPLGLECAGKIVSIGSDVTDLQIGDQVIAIAPASFSTHITVCADLVIRKPQSLTTTEAATLPTAFLTAYYALVEIGQLQKSDRILIHSAAGGVGQAAIQIAQTIGAEIFATASTPKWATLHQQGIEHLFNSRTLTFASEILQQTQGKGITIVLNSFSGEAIEKTLSTLAPNARFIEIGKAGILSPTEMSQRRPDINYKIVDLLKLTKNNPQRIQSMLQHLAQTFQQGQLRPLPHQTFSAEQTTTAFRTMQQGKHIGKLIITPPASPDQKATQDTTQTTEKQTLIKPNATYLITGGTGALGLQVAQWLANQGAKHITLLSRNNPSKSAQQTIENITQSGVSINTVQTDIANLSKLKSTLTPLLLTPPSPTPLRGIFHLAGTLQDATITQQTPDHFQQVIAAKIHGTHNLHQLTKNIELDHFVLFSSVASLLGSAGQINYAAANSYLDAITHLRHQENLPALSINWSAWSDSGLAATTAVKKRLAKESLPTITPDQGLSILEILTLSNQYRSLPQISILPGDLNAWKNATNQATLFHSIQTTAHQPSAKKIDTPQLIARIAKARPSQQPSILSAHIKQQIAIVLGIQPDSLADNSASFESLGLDSLTAVELRNRLQSDLNQSLPATLIYDYPNINKLQKYLITLISKPAEKALDQSDNQPSLKDLTSSDDLSQLSEAEAEARLLAELDRLSE